MNLKNMKKKLKKKKLVLHALYQVSPASMYDDYDYKGLQKYIVKLQKKVYDLEYKINREKGL